MSCKDIAKIIKDELSIEVNSDDYEKSLKDIGIDSLDFFKILTIIEESTDVSAEDIEDFSDLDSILKLNNYFYRN